MPLRFRSVVPYTLPGVLALIGWWWYISRKKERITSHDSLEGVPATVSHLSTPVEGSNGLVEKGTVSPTNDTETSTHPQSSRNRPSKAKEQRSTEQEVAQVHLPNTEPSQEQSSEVADSHSDRVRTEEIHKPSVSALPPHNIKEFPRNLAPDLVTESGKHIVKDPTADPDSIVEATVLPCQSAQLTQVTSTSPTVADLANAERPEPEGEVATQEVVVPCVAQPVKDHLTAITTKDCPVTPAKAHRAITPEADSLETHVLAQGFRHHVLTSIPTSPASTLTPVAQAPAQDSTSPAVASEDILVSSTSGEEQDLELLAAGLITEVISAATQEVLGVTSCQDTDNSQPSCSSTPLANGRPCSQQEPASHREIEIQNELRGHWPTTSHQAAQGAPLPNLVKLKTEGGSALAEDSACSTCHSEDGVSSEDLQNSIPDNQTDLIQVTDMSAGDPAQPLAETAPETTVLSLAEANTVDTVCEIKRLNGLGLRNGAHGTSEVETDQSGGSDVNSMDSMDSGCTMGVGDSQSNNATASSSDVIIWEIEVPKHLVGRLIGKQGRYVSFLKQNSGAKIYISTLPYTQEFQICHIEGTQQQVDKALSLIGKKFKDLDLTNLYAPPPPPLTLPSLPMTSWLLLPSGVTVEVIVVNIVSAGHVFVQQHTHPTYHALRSLDQQMFLCYSQPGTPALPSPAEVGVICAAPAVEGAWWRAQVITFYKETNEVEIRYVDYGGYDRVKIDSLRQIRSDFVTLPFQGAEVLLDNIAPLPGEDRFSAEATSALEEMTRGVPLLAQVSNYDNNTGLPLVQLWNMVGDEVCCWDLSDFQNGFIHYSLY
uniref:A kinase (PRKA) anchor protein 1b n=1 Tax=Myripristis murdjan TaxID=586833 RepID=A0A668ACZ6_9TELE